MFGKLLKNDLKAQWFPVSPIYFAALIAVVVFEIGAKVLNEGWQAALCCLGVLGVLLITSVTTIVVVAATFNKTMFGKAGYLTLTLPVKTHSLIASKTISGLIWIFSVYTFLIGSFILLFHQIKVLMGEQSVNTVDVMLELFGAPNVKTIVIGVIFQAILFISDILLIVQCIHLALTLAQVKPISSFGKFGAIVILFVSVGVLLSLSGTLSDKLSLNVIVSETEVLFTSNPPQHSNTMDASLTNAIFNIVASIALHFPVVFLIDKKINLK